MLTFNRDKRLLNSKAFQAVFDNNNSRVANASLLLLAKPNDLNHPRLGMVVAKKNIRHAVARNRVKRVVRETFRSYQHELGAVDIIFLARKGLDELPAVEQTRLLNKSWLKLAKKINQSVGNP